jgi:tetratricopeptide (TPR) repeat protein
MRAVAVFLLAALLSTFALAQADQVLKETPVEISKEASATIENLGPLPAARKLLRDGHYEAAADAFRELMAKGSNPSAAAGLTRALVRQHDIATATDVIKKALKDYPDSAEIHEAYGEVLYRGGSPWAAEAELAKTINTWGPNAQAYLWLSRYYTASAYHKKSRTMIERAYSIDPDDPEVAAAYHRAVRGSESVALKLAANSDQSEAMQALLQQLMTRQHRGCSVTPISHDVQVPLLPLNTDPRHIRGFGLEVTFNGERGKLLLDTGAAGILINHRLAEKAGVKRIASSMVHGVGDKGGTASYMGHIDSARIGDLELRDCTVEVSETRNVLEEDGLIGTDLFEDFLVHIDFPHMKFRLTALPARPGDAPKQSSPQETMKKGDSQQDAAVKKDGTNDEPELHDPYRAPEMQNFTRMYRVGHYVLVPTRVDDLPPRLFLLDTGAFNNMISPAAAREVTKLHGDDDLKIKGLSGTVKKVYTADQATLTFSRYSQKNEDLVAFDLSGFSRGAGMEISGALGFAMLRLMEITIDYRDGMIDFKYDPKMFPGLR